MWCSFLFSCPVVSDSVTPWTVTRQTPLSSTISQSLLKFMSIESMMPSNYLTLCHPLLLFPSNFPSIGSFALFAAGYFCVSVSCLDSGWK